MNSPPRSPKRQRQYGEDDTKITIVPYKNKYLQIFKGQSYYLLDRYKYDQNAIMMLLDLNKINKLGDIFVNYPDGIERIKFIQIMKAELPSNPNDPMDETNLIYGLYKFFCEIDFNGDGHMQWEEFTQFIIDTVEGDNDAKVEEGDEDSKNKIFNEKQMVKYKRYHISNRIKDSNIHKRDIIDAVFLPRSDTLLINEYGTKILKVYNPRTGKNEKNIELDSFLNPAFKNPSNTNRLTSNKKKEKKTTNDKTQEIKVANTYSVISMCQACTNIVAVCLSDNRIVFFNFTSDGRTELIYELHTPVFEKRCWYLPEHNVWFASGSKLDKYTYYTLNELDVEFELKSQKYDCYYNEGHPYRAHYCEINPHMGEILDVIEIQKPMLILTACMDGKIRLINLNDKDFVKCWCNHTLGVRSLDYNPLIESVGYILSVGFEYYINLYCTDLSIDEAYKGKLEGHYAPVITCKFLSNSYMAVSVDEEGNVRIWDTRLRLCLQLIPTPKKNFKVSNLLNFPKYNKFIVYGNKMIFYDAKYREEEHKQKNLVKDDNYPIKVDFNKYYQQFFVTTFKDVRIYNKDGVLFKCFKKLNQNDHFEPDTRIKYLLFEDNYRKFYLGFSNGAIMQFNAGNGSLIKAINEEEIEKDGIQTYKYDHSKEISSMFYFYDYSSDDPHLILLSTSYDSLINIYNEINPEETEKLRSIKGGHTFYDKVNEINCIDFSMQLNLFATGSTDGLVVVWDFEMSKIDDVCYLPFGRSEKINVYSLKFLDPYPVLVASYSDGSIYFWGIKPNAKYRGECILRGRNFFKQGHKIELSSVTVSQFVMMDLDEITYDVPLKPYFDRESPFMSDKPYVPPPKKPKEKKKFYFLDNYDEEDEEESEDDDNLDIVPSIYKHTEVIDDDLDPERYASSDTQKYYFIIGDSQGNLKILDLKGIIKKYELEPASKVVIKSTFNILKKDDINMETILNHNIQQKQDVKFSPFINFYQSMIRREWKAHEDEITSMTIIEEPLSFATSSKDKLVKIWNFNCECIGAINTLPKLTRADLQIPDWNFVINEEKILENEIAEVVNIFEAVGIERIVVGSKEDRTVINDIIDERFEKSPSTKRMPIKMNKRRYKKIEKEDKFKKQNKDDEGKNNISYEGLFVQDIQKKIENIISNDVPKQGINEITLNVISKMVEDQDNNRLTTNSNTNPVVNQPTGFGMKLSKGNSSQMNKYNALQTGASQGNSLSTTVYNMYNNTTQNTLPKTTKNSGMIKYQTSSNFNTESSKANIPTSPNKPMKPIFSLSSTRKGFFSKPKKREYNPKFRDTLYAEKLFNKVASFDSEKRSTFHSINGSKRFNTFYNKTSSKIKLPYLNEKVIFKKGETDKLLNYQFYIQSYKNCCEVNSLNRMPNQSLRENYKNNWRMVNNYSRNLKGENDYKETSKHNYPTSLTES